MLTIGTTRDYFWRPSLRTTTALQLSSFSITIIKICGLMHSNIELVIDFICNLIDSIEHAALGCINSLIETAIYTTEALMWRISDSNRSQIPCKGFVLALSIPLTNRVEYLLRFFQSSYLSLYTFVAFGCVI